MSGQREDQTLRSPVGRQGREESGRGARINQTKYA